MRLTDKPFWFILPDITLNNSGLIFTVKTKMKVFFNPTVVFFPCEKVRVWFYIKFRYFLISAQGQVTVSHMTSWGIWGYKRPSKLIIHRKIICLSKIWKLDGVHGGKRFHFSYFNFCFFLNIFSFTKHFQSKIIFF